MCGRIAEIPPDRNIERLSPLGLSTWSHKVKARDGHAQVFILFFGGGAGEGGDRMGVW